MSLQCPSPYEILPAKTDSLREEWNATALYQKRLFVTKYARLDENFSSCWRAYITTSNSPTQASHALTLDIKHVQHQLHLSSKTLFLIRP